MSHPKTGLPPWLVRDMARKRPTLAQLRKERDDWKSCAKLLAACVQGVSDQDCVALTLYENLCHTSPS